MENNEFDALLGMLEMLDKIINMDSSKIISDRISTPIGYYCIQTGPHLFVDNPDAYITVIGVESYDGKYKTEPCGVETFESREDAIKGHDYWRRACMDNPMRVLKDATTGKIITVDF